MKGNRGNRSDDHTDADNRGGERSGSLDYGGRSRTTAQTTGASGGIGPYPIVDIGQVERLRKAFARADNRKSWGDWFVIVGAILLAFCVVTTVILASAINARANRIIENDAVRAREGGRVVTRLEGKLDEHITETKETNRKLDVLTTTTMVASATTSVPKRTTPTTRRSTPTTRPTTTTTTVRPTTTTTRPTTTTTRPCSFALLNLCLAR